MKNLVFLLGFVFLYSISNLNAQPWIQDNNVFNPSGIPSISFSQPRFSDLDADGDLDLILGNFIQQPIYFENTGTKSQPKFQRNDTVFETISSMDAEMGVVVDLDSDGDLDFVTGGFTGLNFFENIGDKTNPEFSKIDNLFGNLTTGSIPVPTLGDLDGDGDLDMIIGLSEDGGVKYYPNTGNSNAPVFSEANSVYLFDVGLYAYPLLRDLDQDNDLDLIVGKDGHGFKYFQNTGDSANYNWTDKSTLFSSLGTGTYFNSGDLVDLNNDGKIDFLFGTSDGPIKYYQNSGTNVSPVWNENKTVFGGIVDIGGQSSPVFYDFDGDGDYDVISGSQLGDIKYLENIGNENAPAWKDNSSIFASIDHSIYSAAAVGDIDNDGIPEIIVGDLSGKLYLHKKNGSSYPLVSGLVDDFTFGGFSVPRLVDFDKDNDLDLIIGNESGNLFYYENTGTADSASWTEVSNFFVDIVPGGNCVPYPVDLDNDGDLDILAGTLGGLVKYYENNNNVFTLNNSFIGTIEVDQNSAPAAADIDNDGDLDIVTGNYEGTFEFYRNMNVVSVESEEIKLPDNFSLSQNYPNPFNPSTVIRYSVPRQGGRAGVEGQFVTLKIYDILGNEVTTLVSENQPAGIYEVNFNASSAAGGLSSGMYFYTLNAGKSSLTKKMIYLK